MALTQLSQLTSYEVSFVPKGANLKKRFLVIKEDGEEDMDKLLEQILKGDMKNEEAVTKIAKSLGLDDKAETVLKAVMKMVGAEGSGLDSKTLSKALKAFDGPDKEELEKAKKEEEEKAAKAKKEEEEKEKAAKAKKEGDEDMKGPVQKEDGSWDLSGVDVALRPSLEAVFKSNEVLQKSLNTQTKTNETLADQLKTEKDARVMKEFVEKAEGYGHLGEDAVELAKVLKSVHDADPKNGEAVEKILKSANKKVEDGNLFSELGSTGVGHGANAWDKIEKAAELVQKEKPTMTQSAAIDLVLKNNPSLYNEYEAEKRQEARMM